RLAPGLSRVTVPVLVTLSVVPPMACVAASPNPLRKPGPIVTVVGVEFVVCRSATLFVVTLLQMTTAVFCPTHAAANALGGFTAKLISTPLANAVLARRHGLEFWSPVSVRCGLVKAPVTPTMGAPYTRDAAW